MIVVLFDTETTGLIKNSAIPIDKQPHILELYALKLEQTGEGEEAEFREIGEYESLYRHTAPLEDIIKKITGLTNEDLADQVPIEKELDNIREFFSDADRVVAHNLSYDMAVTDIEFERYKKPPMKWNGPLCTVEATNFLKGYRLKLIDLHELLFDEKFEGGHRARIDVQAMTRCYKELVKRDEV